MIKFDRESSVFIYAAHSMRARTHGMCGYYDNDVSNDVTEGDAVLNEFIGSLDTAYVFVEQLRWQTTEDNVE